MIPAAIPFLQSVMAAPSLVFTEEAAPGDTAKIRSRETKLSTTGLSRVLDGVLKGCDGAKLPEALKGGARG
jgi:hypothetical protein